MRVQATGAEDVLWEHLRDRRLCGAKFRRQHNIGPFIADFYCHEARLIVEVDGSIHELTAESDGVRDEWMRANGFSVLRVTNDEVADDVEGVLTRIATRLTVDGTEPRPDSNGE